ncbi:DoxX family protein [Haloarcula nitratireducens]|uniref:DoxX family protein n=1 Tax=Haloarcula nitratireducens TaxID=2487749 RepID=A0AAW4P8A8_9EURY|nr:DoxX family protein [Halomicroarcula nitratireducens]MBX0293905.1 DoxX family protein [Halomicroarcula nitratireducens]
MRYTATDFGHLIVRIALGLVIFVHGIGKLNLGPFASGGGVEGFAGFLASLGVPAPLLFAWLVTAVEVGGGLLVLLGLFARYAGVLIAADMFTAMFLVHLPNGFAVSNGGYELVLLLGLLGIGISLSGPGALSLEHALFDRELLPPRAAVFLETDSASGESERAT